MMLLKWRLLKRFDFTFIGKTQQISGYICNNDLLGYLDNHYGCIRGKCNQHGNPKMACHIV